MIDARSFGPPLHGPPNFSTSPSKFPDFGTFRVLIRRPSPASATSTPTNACIWRVSTHGSRLEASPRPNYGVCTRRSASFFAMRSIIAARPTPTSSTMGAIATVISIMPVCSGVKGQPCPVCGTQIERIRVAGRGTNYCPHCQRGAMLAPSHGRARPSNKTGRK